MAQHSTIEWTDATWNPIAGCSVVSPGCTNCYAMKMAARVEAMSAAHGRASPYDGLTIKTKAGAVWNGQLRLATSALGQPLTWKKPRRIFVNSMSDLFHDDVPEAWIDQVWAVMALTGQHTYQVLTKRAERMRAVLRRMRRLVVAWQREIAQGDLFLTPAASWLRAEFPAVYDALTALKASGDTRWNVWPLANVWLGVSAEAQERWNERVPQLIWTDAAVRFVSVEPMLGAIDPGPIDIRGGDATVDPLYGDTDCEDDDGEPAADNLPLDWLIVGGESGPSARPIHPDWVRDLRDACSEAQVAFFFKQWGEWAPGEANSLRKTLAVDGAHWFDDRWDFVRITEAEGREMHCDDEPDVWRVGKRHSGRLLDGVEHNGMPEVRHD